MHMTEDLPLCMGDGGSEMGKRDYVCVVSLASPIQTKRRICVQCDKVSNIFFITLH